MTTEHKGTSPDLYCNAGLTDQQVEMLKQKGLVNKVDSKITKTTGDIIKNNLFTLFNGYNLLIGIALLMVGAYRNLIYLIIIGVNVATGIIQELHAKKLVENLSLLSVKNGTVIRNGKALDIPIEEIVAGDIMVLDAGKQISADAVVAEGEIEANESLLTGESDPVIKSPGDTLLSGSYVISGKCLAKVNHVGKDNFAAKLSIEAKKSKQAGSELMRSMQKVTKLTSYFIIPIGLILFVQAFRFQGHSMNQSVVTSATALLGMLPKGMVLLISISLVSGIIRLSHKKVLVQELYCLENLAQADILCLDKTGTITEGIISVSDVYEINPSLLPFSVETAIRVFIGACDDNNATFKALKEYFGDETGLNVTDKIPFSSERKYSSVTFEGIGSLILGAPEQLTGHNLSLLPPQVLESQNESKRIICLGYSKQYIKNGEMPQVQLIAAIALKDSIRTNVKDVLEFFHKEGVDVKIISGDNPVTVSQIAKQAGLKKYNAYVDMSEIHSGEELYQAASTCCIFGRVTPNKKRDLVKAFKKQGHTVAMAGDGVNDVLALKEADCSIAMNSGSDAAKQVSQLVLLDSDFSVLPDIVMEGRRVVNNITRVGGIFLVKTIYSVLLSILCIFANVPFPFLPVQITLIDLFIEGYPSLIIQLESDSSRIQTSFLNSAVKRALPFACTILVSIGAVYLLTPSLTLSQDKAVTIMFCLTGWLTILAVLKACRSFNLARIFLVVSSAAAFFVSVYLFHNILMLSLLSRYEIIIFLGLAIIASLISYLAAGMKKRGNN